MAELNTPEAVRAAAEAATSELRTAAQTLRDVAPEITGRVAGLADPVADWLDATAKDMGMWAPYRPGENGYRIWETAMRVARKVNGGGK